MKGILDAAFKKGPKEDAKADRKPERKQESRPEKKQENKPTGEGNSRTVNETSRQNKNRKQSNPRRQNSQNNQGTQNTRNQNAKRQQGQQGQQSHNAKNAQAGQKQGASRQQQGGNKGGQNRQGGDTKRTRYFGNSQQGGNEGANRSGGNNKNNNRRGVQQNRNNKNNGGSRPHTLLSNVLNKGKHKNKRNQKNQAPVAAEMPKKNYPTSVELPETIIVKDFAERMGRDVGEVMKKLLMGGIMASHQPELDFDARFFDLPIANSTSLLPPRSPAGKDPRGNRKKSSMPETLKTHPPVVTIMGTSTTARRVPRRHPSTNTSHEIAGGDYALSVLTRSVTKAKITFMDTPGHEAFTAMRARGRPGYGYCRLGRCR